MKSHTKIFSQHLKDGALLQEGAREFQEHILDFYHQQGRSFAWRDTFDPYHILVSEIMLQQTQTERVKEKYAQFLELFPTIFDLAQASTRDVITAWQGLGYNRRALALQTTAQKIVTEHKGIVPVDPEILVTFKGIGPNTAGSISAFAYNTPTIFIETNIRAVYIQSFFPDKEAVHDKELLPLIEQTLSTENPRIWYYALMDYGVMLKKACKNPSRKSKHHTRQSKFEGSERQIRGMILRALTAHPALTFDLLCGLIDREPARIEKNLEALVTEGFIKIHGALYTLTD